MTDDHEPAVVAAVRALADALDGIEPPCASNPEAWYDRPSWAVQQCRNGCHGIQQCADLADLLDEIHGVRGGLERSRKTRGRAWVAPALELGVEAT